MIPFFHSLIASPNPAPPADWQNGECLLSLTFSESTASELMMSYDEGCDHAQDLRDNPQQWLSAQELLVLLDDDNESDYYVAAHDYNFYRSLRRIQDTRDLAATPTEIVDDELMGRRWFRTVLHVLCLVVHLSGLN
ncbi:hypothetical protein C8R43DRAFT_1141978 [Mycena crocata]|nr:hypothetical protein C8R43DRAFT_1141978 [Mycena crocata]